jgi:hypothetical protein
MPGVPPENLARDSEITVKIHEDGIRDQLGRLKPSAIIAKAERARETAAQKASVAAFAGTAFLAVKQLPSGDLCFRARSASGTEVLRRHADAGVQAFGKTAYVRMLTWGVVTHEIPVASICKDGADITSTVGHEVAAQLVAANQHTWGKDTRILHLGWLVKPRKGKREASLVLEFDNPNDANQAIDQGTIWNHQAHANTVYVKEARSKLCNKCQKPGHVQV